MTMLSKKLITKKEMRKINKLQTFNFEDRNVRPLTIKGGRWFEKNEYRCHWRKYGDFV